MSNPNDVVIVAACRTPLCRSRKGKLAKVPPSTLLQTALQGVLERTPGLKPTDIDDICVGNVLLPQSGFAALRMAQVAAGIPASKASLQTVNRQCASGLQAVANIAQRLASGEIQIGIGGGVESMSFNAMKDIQPPQVDYSGMPREAMDCLLPMGLTSEAVVQDYGLQREDLDAFAAESHRKAAAAQRNGRFRAEIVPVGDVTEDDGIRPTTTVEILSQLKPAFVPKTGATTAGNSSQTTDGAAAILLTTRAVAQRNHWPILAVWKSLATAGVPPRVMGIGPAVAIPRVLEQCGLTKDDIDVYELNEAFASQATYCRDVLGLDPDKVNPNGGAIALGHPLGCTGARMIATLIYELQRRKGGYGVVSMCIGTGMGAAAVLQVERSAAL